MSLHVAGRTDRVRLLRQQLQRAAGAARRGRLGQRRGDAAPASPITPAAAPRAAPGLGVTLHPPYNTHRSPSGRY